MRRWYGWTGTVLGMLVLAGAALVASADDPAQPGDNGTVAAQPDEAPPPPPPEVDRPRGQHRGEMRGRRGGPPGRGPAMRGGRPHMGGPPRGPESGPAMRGRGRRGDMPGGPKGGPGNRAGRPGGCDRAGGPPEARLLDRLLPLIAEQHPDLANRLRALREQSPEEYRRVVAEALAVRLEEVMGRRGGPGPACGPQPASDGTPVRRRRGGGPGPMFNGPPGEPPMFGGRRGQPPMFGERPAPPPDRPEWDRPGEDESPEQHELDMHMRELDRRNEELERHSEELAAKLRELRERKDPGLQEQIEHLRRELADCVEEHFNVRTEFRKAELHRIEVELGHLQRALDELRENLERRERARGAIIERRIKQLLGEDGDQW